MKTPTLITERLILRPLSISDVESVFFWTSDERVNKYMSYARHTSLETTKAWLESIDNEADAKYEFGFIEKESGILIGSGGVYYDMATQKWIIGYITFRLITGIKDMPLRR